MLLEILREQVVFSVSLPPIPIDLSHSSGIQSCLDYLFYLENVVGSRFKWGKDFFFPIQYNLACEFVMQLFIYTEVFCFVFLVSSELLL